MLPQTRSSAFGPGTALGLSPDGRLAAAHIPSTQKMVFYPQASAIPSCSTGAQEIDLTRFAVEWFTNSARVLYCGRERGSASRCYAQDVKSGPPVAVTPDDVTDAVLAGDDRTLLIHRGESFQVMRMGEGPVDAKGFTAADVLLTWNAGATGVVVADVGTLRLESTSSTPGDGSGYG